MLITSVDSNSLLSWQGLHFASLCNATMSSNFASPHTFISAILKLLNTHCQSKLSGVHMVGERERKLREECWEYLTTRNHFADLMKDEWSHFPAGLDCGCSFPFPVLVSLKKSKFSQNSGEKLLSFIQCSKYKPLRLPGCLALRWRTEVYKWFTVCLGLESDH